MREIKSHKVEGVEDGLSVCALDEPGSGGASHRYCARGWGGTVYLDFQNGPIGEAGPNGLTQEVLIAICIDRLEGFQSGEYACEENGVALRHLESALSVLKRRTEARLARGVEGTMEV